LISLFGVKPGDAEVDHAPVVRSLAFISLLAALAVGGFLYLQSAREAAAPSGSAVEDAATETASDATLLVARTGVESFFATTGTYVGATVPAGVTLVAADTASYCLQVGSGTTVRHLTGPVSGTVEPGPC
jgi:hypothetical protein